MKIIILGAGRVGYSVAESLVGERNDITVIDTDAQRLHELQERFDLRGVLGSGLDIQVLSDAGAADADLLLACAAQDETNLACCKIAHTLFHIPRRIARVRTVGFDQHPQLLGPQGFAVDATICPEASLTRYITQLIRYPQAMQVREFAGGLARLAAVRVRSGARAVGRSIGELRQQYPALPLRLVAIYRRFTDGPDRFIACNGATRILAEDEVFVLAATQYLRQALDVFHYRSSAAGDDGPQALQMSGAATAPANDAARHAVRSIMIAGACGVTRRLVQDLLRSQPGQYHIKILEHRLERCQSLAAALPQGALVLHGHPTDETLLEEEGVEDVDLFLALSNDDENNIMACLQAKRLGARRVLALINRRSYADLMHGTQIDIALSPIQPLMGELLTHIRRGDVQAVHSLRRGVAEALEIVAHGDAKTSRVVGRKVGELRLPASVHMGLIVRGLPETKAESRPEAKTEATGATTATTSVSEAPASAGVASTAVAGMAGEPSGAHDAPARTPSSSRLRGLLHRLLPAWLSPHGSADQAERRDGPCAAQVIIPSSETVVESGDHIVFFLPHKRLVREVEELFRTR